MACKISESIGNEDRAIGEISSITISNTPISYLTNDPDFITFKKQTSWPVWIFSLRSLILKMESREDIERFSFDVEKI
jgi:hypothetical protein